VYDKGAFLPGGLKGKEMETGLGGMIRQYGLPLAGIVEDGAGFRIGNPSFSFIVSEQGDKSISFLCQRQSLCVESQVRRTGPALVISHRLVNLGVRRSAPISTIEPLRIVFRTPSEEWRHIFANGGTTENCYPPDAYKTQERCRVRDSLTIESHPGGRSSNLHLPFLISMINTSPKTDGFFCGIEWSGGWYIRFDRLDEERSCLSLGIKITRLRLDPDELLALPPVHIGFFQGGPAEGTNAIRRYLYENVCARHLAGPVIPRVSYDHWFDIRTSVTSDILTKQADRAAELGVEVFVVDAGWFQGNFPDGVGDWNETDPDRFPGGLEPLAEQVRSLGMAFGLWFEPERAVLGTNLVRQHPDWLMSVTTRDMFRNYQLNLARRDVQDYLIEMLSEWIERLELQWTRWDYNIEPWPYWQSTDKTLKIQFKYMDGLYRVLDTLMRKFPDWMVESCSSGGRRIDIGTMKRAHTFWISDQCSDPFSCRYMQARANRFMPGHLLNSSVAVKPGRGDQGFDDTAILSRMLGKLAFDGDIASWSDKLTSRVALWVEDFKDVRHLLVQNFYQLLPVPAVIEDWDAVQFASYDGEESALFVFAGAKGGRRQILLQGLKHDGQFNIERRLTGPSRNVAGWELLADGFSVELKAYEGGLWRIVPAL